MRAFASRPTRPAGWPCLNPSVGGRPARVRLPAVGRSRHEPYATRPRTRAASRAAHAEVSQMATGPDRRSGNPSAGLGFRFRGASLDRRTSGGPEVGSPLNPVALGGSVAPRRSETRRGGAGRMEASTGPPHSQVVSGPAHRSPTTERPGRAFPSARNRGHGATRALGTPRGKTRRPAARTLRNSQEGVPVGSA